ncbi:MAG: hypothetical protein EWV53_11915 [Microcystis panniformis Mp_MB_F_20051200_S9]|uniref:Uncharacterized protein n=1 Tax=Microcystis panniformis Mp_MB_F_20051200_S9 TaxID=2486223 RepID=A0A552PXL4_9CHRO|nr:MAG: hypothetical protein EWV42_16355 [Microcystis panniformis Mp_GB_SS_20050300_S99D]TRV49459.1 MAG: hypothetical protein EWV43_08305 [Microcystis panniformis Mp_MB_F_20080800_S26D]TRV50962.1 MAG: hypothetical protein EWV87_07640 [Microcystis panniformis Mp_GB_SS_20050300_S99]TRV61711.1 MAG: hypothetical protein EWV53_11915 [Microcystis panniformis Mp_MB_F_20051200_S9]TRV63126.1 MAG: hypothetical protein EWV69_04385 [Microcystis panniformis Mp_MB_F_20080800_S26]TRV67703.1 MAG: hypothetical
MTTMLRRVQQFLDSGDSDRAREEIDRAFGNLRKLDSHVREFAALLALGSLEASEIGLGVLGRKLLQNDSEINNEIIWLFIASILSRNSIPADSPSRISLLVLTASVNSWELPIFALLAPALDAFFKVSLADGTPLIAEQTLDFLDTWGRIYAKAPHIKTQLKKLQSLSNNLLEQVDDLELKAEWSEGINIFFEEASTTKYYDGNVFSAGQDLIKKIYNTQSLQRDTEDKNLAETKDKLLRLVTSSLATISTVLDSHGLSVAVRIDNDSKDRKSWSVVASVIDKLERLFQEIADLTFERINKLPAFTPAQAIPGSWTIILHVNLSPDHANLLAKTISDLSSRKIDHKLESENELEVVSIWQDCVTKIKEDDLRVDMAVSINSEEFNVTKTISTEDEYISSSTGLKSPSIRVLSHDIPQADKLERVVDLSSLLIQYPHSLPTVRQQFLDRNGITERQFSYYRRAAEILNLADERVQPTTACFMLDRLPENSKKRFLAHQFIASKVGWAWFNWQNAHDLSEIKPERAREFLLEVCPSLSESTVGRRAKTLQSWLKYFLGPENE